MTVEKIIDRAVRNSRVDNGLVLCDNCDTPASKSLSTSLSWTACAPCATGESEALDPSDFIPVPKQIKKTKPRKPPSLQKQQASVIAWNEEHPIGTEVTVEMDSGEIKATRTRSAAYMLSGHTAMIFVDGISGCYLLSRVRAKGAV